MKILIRTGVFETNSSSCHSLSIGANGVYATIIPDADGIVQLTTESGYPIGEIEFGWQEDTYGSVYDRLNYMLIYARDWSGEESPIFIDKIYTIVLEHTGGTSLDISWLFLEDSYGSMPGYIDHQSVECNELHYIFKDTNLLKSFIFDDSSLLITDNDNH